ncbi:MAG: hypothetical protein ACFFAO_20750 [Candidatus Hermodarchaeota archaeon]
MVELEHPKNNVKKAFGLIMISNTFIESVREDPASFILKLKKKDIDFNILDEIIDTIIIKEEDFRKLSKISTDQEKTLKEVIQNDLKNLIENWKYKYESIGLKL